MSTPENFRFPAIYSTGLLRKEAGLEGTRLCLSERCALCSLPMNKGDEMMLALDPRTRDKVHLRYPGPRPEMLEYPPSFIYGVCDGYCIDHRMTHPVCHRDCAGWLHPRVDIALLSKASWSAYDNDEAGTRSLRLLHLTESALRLSGSFSASVVARIPREIVCRIAEHLTTMMSVTSLASLEHRIQHGNGETLFDVSRPFKVQYVRYEGQHYVSAIKNTTTLSSSSSLSCRDARRSSPAQPVRSLWIAETCYGVRNIILAAADAPPPAGRQPGMCWRRLAVKLDTPDVRLRSDGFRVRVVIHGGEVSTDGIAWPEAQFLTKSHRPVKWGYYSNRPSMMKELVLSNGGPGGVTGISICCRPEPCGFRIHTKPPPEKEWEASRDGEDLSFYERETPHQAVWAYHPIGKKEIITSVWWRRRRQRKYELALAFNIYNTQTKNTRTVMAGAQGGGATFRPGVNFKWMAGASFDEKRPARLFYDGCQRGIRTFMFEPAESKDVRPELTPITCPRDIFLVVDLYQYSQASLESVVSVQRCEFVIRGRKHLTGLLLTYADGQKGSVGQVRLNCLGRPEAVQQGDALWLVFGHGGPGNNAPYFSEARLSAKKQPGSFRVDWFDRLDWWYSFRQDQVYHNGIASPNII